MIVLLCRLISRPRFWVSTVTVISSFKGVTGAYLRRSVCTPHSAECSYWQKAAEKNTRKSLLVKSFSNLMTCYVQRIKCNFYSLTKRIKEFIKDDYVSDYKVVATIGAASLCNKRSYAADNAGNCFAEEGSRERKASWRSEDDFFQTHFTRSTQIVTIALLHKYNTFSHYYSVFGSWRRV